MFHIKDDQVRESLKGADHQTLQALNVGGQDIGFEETDVFIAGSGPIGCTYARYILDHDPNAKVMMADIGAQDFPEIGAHFKNSIKYQKDIDAFVNVIKGALQPLSVAPPDTYVPTLGGDAWTPSVTEKLVMMGNNPNQIPQLNLKASAATRTVGGMATHWTCSCPQPADEERVNNPIGKTELDNLLNEAEKLLNVHLDQYDESIRHQVVRDTLIHEFPDRHVQGLHLGVQRNKENPQYVTWTGSNTVLGEYAKNPPKRFSLRSETRVTTVFPTVYQSPAIFFVKVRDLKTNRDILIRAKAFILACGAVGTPQILANSKIHLPPALGHYLCEQSMAFCQIVLKRSIVESIRTNPKFAEAVKRHEKNHPNDPLPIPFDDPEPQVMMPFFSGTKYPWHVQVHRDAFSYGDVGPRADPRVVVDLRFFGRQEIKEENQVWFGELPSPQWPEWNKYAGGVDWKAGITDIYGMPQPTFFVQRSEKDNENDQNMMNDMTKVANVLGAYLPGSNPQFMEPGLAMHVTGTTRIGTSDKDSTANEDSLVWGYNNLWVGGNGCIPDSTACNPTLTSVAIALKGAKSVVEYLKRQPK
jgi:pyranose oxidase